MKTMSKNLLYDKQMNILNKFQKIIKYIFCHTVTSQDGRQMAAWVYSLCFIFIKYWYN